MDFIRSFFILTTLVAEISIAQLDNICNIHYGSTRTCINSGIKNGFSYERRIQFREAIRQCFVKHACGSGPSYPHSVLSVKTKAKLSASFTQASIQKRCVNERMHARMSELMDSCRRQKVAKGVGNLLDFEYSETEKQNMLLDAIDAAQDMEKCPAKRELISACIRENHPDLQKKTCRRSRYCYDALRSTRCLAKADYRDWSGDVCRCFEQIQAARGNRVAQQAIQLPQVDILGAFRDFANLFTGAAASSPSSGSGGNAISKLLTGFTAQGLSKPANANYLFLYADRYGLNVDEANATIYSCRASLPASSAAEMTPLRFRGTLTQTMLLACDCRLDDTVAKRDACLASSECMGTQTLPIFKRAVSLVDTDHNHMSMFCDCQKDVE